MLTNKSFFSGVGGLDLGLHWAGIETIAFCEKDEYCRSILEDHWPKIKIYEDIRDDKPETATIFSGGYPCQPFSYAGLRGGQTDDRYLWPEMFRDLKQHRPDWFIGENVIGHINMGLDQTLFDLESAGYTARAFVLPACSVNAWHERYRVIIVAHSNSQRLEGSIEDALLRFSLLQGQFEGIHKIWAERPTLSSPGTLGVSHGVSQ